MEEKERVIFAVDMASKDSPDFSGAVVVLHYDNKDHVIYNTIKDEEVKVLNTVINRINQKELVLNTIFKKNIDIRQLRHYIETYKEEGDERTLKVYNDFQNTETELTLDEYYAIKDLMLNKYV